MKHFLHLLMIITLFNTVGIAKPAHEMDLKDSHVEVPWDEFKTILDQTTKPVMATSKEKSFAPVDVLITSAHIVGTIHNHKVAQFTVDCEIDVPLSRNLDQNGWITVSLGSDKSSQSKGAVIESAMLDGNSVPVESKNGENRILISKKGIQKLQLSYFVPVVSQEGTWSLNCGFPAAASATFKLVIPNAHAEIYLNGTKRHTSGKDSTVLSTPVTLDNDLAIRYSLVGDDLGSASGMTPKVFAETGLLVTIKENRIDYRYKIAYQIWHQKKRSFEVLLPDSLPVEGVHGAGLTSWKIDQRDSGQVLVASIGFVPERDYNLTIDFSEKLETVQCTVTVPELSVLDVNRESGYLAVQAPKTVEVFTGDMEKLTAVSKREMPQWLKNEQNLLMRFKYSGAYDLDLTVRRHKDMPVLVAIADEATFTGLITEDGYHLVKYRYFIRNNHKQYLALTMPTGWELWSALIDGEAVMPATSSDEETVQIPLKKLSKIDEGSGFTLELVYWFEGSPMDNTGAISMQTPMIDINCQKLNGEIRVPSSFQYSNFEGSMEQVMNQRSNQYLSKSTDANWKRNQRRTRRAVGKSVLGVQNQRMNIPMQANSVSLNKMGKSLSLPVEIDIPNEGKPLHFARNLVVPGEKGEFSFSYNKMSKSVTPPLKTIMHFVVLLFGYLSLKKLFRQIRNRQKGKTAALIWIGGVILLSVINSLFAIHASVGGMMFLAAIGATLTTIGSKSEKEVA